MEDSRFETSELQASLMMSTPIFSDSWSSCEAADRAGNIKILHMAGIMYVAFPASPMSQLGDLVGLKVGLFPALAFEEPPPMVDETILKNFLQSEAHRYLNSTINRAKEEIREMTGNMNSIVENNQLCHEAMKFAAYSATAHTTIVIINPIFLGVLQVHQQSAMSPITAILYFAALSIYAILFVGEFKGRQLQLGGSALRFLGHSSHLIGALAAILLISVVSVPLACIILALYLFVWIPTVVFDELKERESRTTEPQVPA